MKFDFFTFGGRFFWEDVFNFKNWVIQHNIYNNTYRLLDNQYITRLTVLGGEPLIKRNKTPLYNLFAIFIISDNW